ncbi:MAG: dihydroorotate dehydrogenase electron transfer subunit [Actinobacteria bacterium]|jgi:dihydroorotate dehydrogenase electron transfer subunit|nr:dihydroorotate dehydrogenase electron transfer subunit [Actinomycetota bacterium]
MPELARPGHFVTVSMGGEESSMLLRRAFAIYQVKSRGVYGGTLEIVVGVEGKGTKWLSERRRHDILDIVGPLGRPFILPKERVPCVLVAGGYGSAGMFMLAEQLRDRGCRVDVVMGASVESKLFGVLEMKRASSKLIITTEDGSAGERGRVTDVLGSVIDKSEAAVVYACGPMGMLAAVARVAAEHRAYSQCSVEEAMACGIGVCMTCVLPVIGQDGVTRMVRSCVEGPVFRGDRVRWNDVGTIPADAFGAPVVDES